MYVKPKKYLGQHFLTDLSIAERIADTLPNDRPIKVLEIGPGTGVLTQFLLKKPNVDLKVVEIDTESVAYLKENFPELEGRIVEGDFLEKPLDDFFEGEFCVIGNYPYNISSQIFFKVYENRDRIPFCSGMIQKEVADRLASPPGHKAYGILSVLLQAFYDITYHFTVSEHVFNPPPKVKSAVISFKRNEVQALDCNDGDFKTVVKTAFNQRRKTLRNSLRTIIGERPEIIEMEILNKRPEQLSVEEFVSLTKKLL